MGGVSTAGTPRRRRRAQGREKLRPMAEINVTPMVDVMLVLLIIFMVAAPLMTAGVSVDLPKTAAGALPSEAEEPLAITLTADGRMQLQNTDIAPKNLVAKLRAVAAERTSNKVYLRADGAVPYGRVAQVMGALNAAGFHNIGLVTETGGPKLDAQGG